VQIVVDTNVFINTVSKISPYRWIFDKIVSGEFILCISNEIFYEYWEVLDEQTTPEIADNIANFLVTIPSVKFIRPFINWNLIIADEDDNKFVDCAINAGAECIIIFDSHFNILKTISFPTVRVFTPSQFEEIYKNFKEHL
jgi:uncharacterized protein